MFKLSQLQTTQTSNDASKPPFDMQSAIAYNTKSKQYFNAYDADIKRILATSSSWETPEFAQAVFDWQQKNGFSGKWIDGKLGPRTLSKMASLDTTLKNNYDAYSLIRNKHKDEKITNKVLSLKDDIVRIQKEMGATDIPLGMLLGWIQVESGGRLNDLAHGAGREAGLFQISEGEAKSIGADQDRILQDREYAIKTGIELARYHENNLAPYITQLFPKGSDLYWHLVFMGFVNGDGAVRTLIKQLQTSGQRFDTWQDIMSWAQYQSPYIAGHSTAKWLPHIERVFNLGKQVATASNVSIRIKQARRKARKIILDGI